MSESQPEPVPNGEATPNSSDSVLIIIDGPWDTTVRPRPPHIPPYLPRGTPSEQAPAPAAAEPGGPEKTDGPSPGDEVWADSSDAILVSCDGPWDTTVRPRPPHIPPYSPRAIPPGLLRNHQAPPPEEKGK